MVDDIIRGILLIIAAWALWQIRKSILTLYRQWRENNL